MCSSGAPCNVGARVPNIAPPSPESSRHDTTYSSGTNSSRSRSRSPGGIGGGPGGFNWVYGNESTSFEDSGLGRSIGSGSDPSRASSGNRTPEMYREALRTPPRQDTPPGGGAFANWVYGSGNLTSPERSRGSGGSGGGSIVCPSSTGSGPCPSLSNGSSTGGNGGGSGGYGWAYGGQSTSSAGPSRGRRGSGGNSSSSAGPFRGGGGGGAAYGWAYGGNSSSPELPEGAIVCPSSTGSGPCPSRGGGAAGGGGGGAYGWAYGGQDSSASPGGFGAGPTSAAGGESPQGRGAFANWAYGSGGMSSGSGNRGGNQTTSSSSRGSPSGAAGRRPGPAIASTPYTCAQGADTPMSSDISSIDNGGDISSILSALDSVEHQERNNVLMDLRRFQGCRRKLFAESSNSNDNPLSDMMDSSEMECRTAF